jgi:hypothetical protein
MFPLTKHEQHTISFVLLGSTTTRHHFRTCAGTNPVACAGHGVPIGVLPTGSLNTITDVAGVLVGQTTIGGGDKHSYRCDRDLTARRQSVPGDGPGSTLCRQCVSQTRRLNAGERVGRDRDINPADLHTLRSACSLRPHRMHVRIARERGRDVRQPLVGETHDGVQLQSRSQERS